MESTYRNIDIRTNLHAGDIGYITYLHGKLYQKEYGYGLNFEAYVAHGLYSFYMQFDSSKDRIWICESKKEIIGSIVLMHRENNLAQLRYFLIAPAYRGIGLGNHLMGLFIAYLKEKKYAGAYLLTNNELPAAASLYMRNGFRLTEEIESSLFPEPVKEQRYELYL